MKIGINASFIRKPHTGIGQVSVNFIRELIRSKVKGVKFVLYLEEKLPLGFVLPKNFETRVFLPIWKRDDLVRKIWWEKTLLPKKVESDKCDIFFSPYQCPTILNKKIKHLMLVHDIIPKLFPEYLNNVRKKTYQKMTEEAIQKATKILTVSRKTEKDLMKFLKISDRKIITNYIDVDPLYKKIVSAQKSHSVLKKYRLKTGYIMGGAGLEKRKNIEGLLRSYQKLLEQNKREKMFSDFPKLVIVGKLMSFLAPLITDVEKIVKEMKLTRYVRALDFVPQEDMPAIYKNASIFVYPSLYEGFGLPILEAMNQGTPVISSKTSSLPEVGGDGVLYCNPEDSREIAKIMKKVLSDEKLREHLVRKGQEKARAFSWEKFTGRFLEIAKNI